MIRWILRKLGYIRADYGFSCGRYWIELDGKIIAQTSGDDIWMRNEDIHRLGFYLLDHGKHWTKPHDKRS